MRGEHRLLGAGLRLGVGAESTRAVESALLVDHGACPRVGQIEAREGAWIDEALDARALGSLEQALRPLHVHSLERRARRADRRDEMEYGIDLRERLGETERLAEIRDDDLRSGRGERSGSRRRAREDPDGVAAPQERPHEARADEAGRTRHECSHHAAACFERASGIGHIERMTLTSLAPSSGPTGAGFPDSMAA